MPKLYARVHKGAGGMVTVSSTTLAEVYWDV